MLKKTIRFTDFNGVDHSEDLYFHISKTSVLTASDSVYNEILEIGQELQTRGEQLEQSSDTINTDNPFDEKNRMLAQSIRMVARLLDRLIDLSYGKRSDDGLRFIKNTKVLEDFKNSAVYDAFVEQMLTNQDEMVNFINQLLDVK